MICTDDESIRDEFQVPVGRCPESKDSRECGYCHACERLIGEVARLRLILEEMGDK